MLSFDVSGAVQTVHYRGGDHGYNRGHGHGVRLFFGGRRHSGGHAYGGGYRRKHAWGMDGAAGAMIIATAVGRGGTTNRARSELDLA